MFIDVLFQVLLQPMQVEQELVIQVSMVFPEDDVHKVLMRDTVSISNTRECSEKGKLVFFKAFR